VTGAANINTDEVASQIARIRHHVSVPVGVGFGIRDGETARRVSEVADAVVIGSRFVLAIESAANTEAAIAEIRQLTEEFRSAMDAGGTR
jgi:tryptophan synthase alpha chain